ncbi:DUF2326 domain-containing protein [Pleionea sp. CnH1-48]|uniref:DUF2326 domain-containing protein n=1 Tax=Pleionea sp. CnH1-48 TaxID=2954494 RepID=UPI002096812A|nr:DUF2326 domain-containing protein [Pleionea sp. CnH1-48]
MFLKNLKIENSSQVIRDISFRKGINLIIDETKTADKKKSGNNVGKTTVLRLIDFCLGSSGKNIYVDPEFKNKSNLTVEKFLTENNVLITLTLKEDLDVEHSKEIVIKRNFLQRSQKIIKVNDTEVKSKDFPENLKELIFHTNPKKPTFRQIVSKNVRDEKSRLINTVKVLHPSTTKEEYEALYLFWLGVDLDVADRKQRLFREKKIEEDLQKRLVKENTLSQVKQSLLLVENNIEELKLKKDSFNINEDYEEDVNALNEIKSKISRASTKIGRLEVRKDLITESIQELEEEYSNVSIEKIRKLYEEAKALLPDIQRTFDETLQFHNNMVREKKNFITSELPSINTELEDLNLKLKSYLDKEKELTGKISKSGAMDEFQGIVLALNQAHEAKGTLEEQKRLWESSLGKLESIEEDIEGIDEGIDSMDDLIQERVSAFNIYFSDVSNKLYGERYVLSADKNDKGYELNISTLLGNPGTGKKKGEMAAFDLSYIKFADDIGIECLHFILQDQIENIHDNQINNILTELVENTNCQYVLPVLKDKLPRDIDVDKYQVISLSQDSKLFKI